MRDVDGNLMDARKIAKQMARRIAQNKRITYIAAACFVVLLVIILASKREPGACAPSFQPLFPTLAPHLAHRLTVSCFSRHSATMMRPCHAFGSLRGWTNYAALGLEIIDMAGLGSPFTVRGIERVSCWCHSFFLLRTWSHAAWSGFTGDCFGTSTHTNDSSRFEGSTRHRYRYRCSTLRIGGRCGKSSDSKLR